MASLGGDGLQVQDPVPILSTNLDELDNIFGANISSQFPDHLKSIILEKCLMSKSDVNKTVENTTEEESGKKLEVEELRANLDEARYNVSNIQERHSALTAEKEELERQNARLSAQNRDTEETSVKRQEELDRLVLQHQSVLDELSKAKAAKCEALVLIQDLESRELSLQNREKRISQDRELVDQRLSAVSDDLHRTREELAEVKEKSSRQIAHLESELSSKVDAFSKLEIEKEILLQDRDVLRSRLDTVIARLNEAKSETAQVEEAFKEEIKAQTSLAEIHKNQADESERKCKDLEKAVFDYQLLLKEASHRYGALEDQYERDRTEQREELRRQGDNIQELRKELDDAHSFIKSLKKKGLTEEGIAQLSPAAAAASKLIKSDMSLTQIYAQLVNCKEELLHSEDENRRLNSYIEQIISDIGDRAPALKRQRDEYENAVDKLKVTLDQLNREREAHAKTRESEEIFQKMADSLTGDNFMLNCQVRDLSLQVTELLKEVETAGEVDVDDTGDENAEQNRLVIFKNIDQLQARNAELLSLVREMTAERENAEIHLIESKTKDLRHKVELLTSEVEVLRQEKKTQDAINQSISLQKDMLKSMLDSNTSALNESMEVVSEAPQVTSTPRGVSPSAMMVANPLKIRDLEQRAIKAETELEELKKEFEEYRVDKCENEQILLEQFEKTRENLNESRCKAIKFETKDEWNTSNDQMSKTTIAFYKKEIANLESKNSSLHSIIGKHEETIGKLHSYLMENNSKLSLSERKLVKSEMEIKRLKNVEIRLTKERDLLQRQKTNISLVSDNLQLVQVQLEGADHMQKIVLQNENTSLKKEVTFFKHKVEIEEERHKHAETTWQETEVKLKSQISQLTEKESLLRKSFEELTNTTDGLKEQLRLMQGSSTLVGEVTTQKVTDLQTQVRALKNEVVTLKDQLSKLRQESSKHQTRADLAEKQAAESTRIAKAAQDESEKQSTSLKQEKSNLETQILELTNERDKLSQRLTSLGVIGDPADKMQKELDTTKAQLEEATRELAELRQSQSEMSEDLTKQTALAREAQFRYETEVMRCGQTTKTVQDLRDNLKNSDQEKSKLETEKKQARDTIEGLKKNCAALEDKLSCLRSQYALAEDENRALHEQLMNMSHHNAASHNDSSSENAGVNLSLTGAENNPDRLLDIVKYLRREKDILVGKVKVVEAESTRIKLELDSTRRELVKQHSSLEAAAERAQSESAALPSAKFKDLQDKVDIIPALTEANRALRLEKENLDKALEETREHLKELDPLRQKLKETEEKEEKGRGMIKALRQEGLLWKQKANQLTELNKKLSPEELKRLEGDNIRLSKQVAQLSNTSKQQTIQLTTLTQKISATEAKWANLLKAKEAELTKSETDLQAAKTANQNMAGRISLTIKKVAELEATIKQSTSEKDSLKANIEQMKSAETESTAKAKEELVKLQKIIQEKLAALSANTSLMENQKEQIIKLRNIGRNFKVKSESLEKEVEEKNAAIVRLAEELKKIQELKTESKPETPGATSTDDKLSEAENLVEQSAHRIFELEEKIDALQEENKKVKESAKENEDRAKSVLVSLKQKLIETKNENTKLIEEMKSLRKMSTEASATSTATALSTNATVTKNIQNLRTEFQTQLAALKAEKEKLVEETSNEKQSLIKVVEELKLQLHQQQHKLQQQQLHQKEQKLMEQQMLENHQKQLHNQQQLLQDQQQLLQNQQQQLLEQQQQEQQIDIDLEQELNKMPAPNPEVLPANFEESAQVLETNQGLAVESNPDEGEREAVVPCDEESLSSSIQNPDAPEFVPSLSYVQPAAIEDDLVEVEPVQSQSEVLPSSAGGTSTEAGTSNAAQKRHLEKDLEVETENQNKRTRVDDEHENKETRVCQASTGDDVTSGDEQNLEIEISVPDQTELTTAEDVREDETVNLEEDDGMEEEDNYDMEEPTVDSVIEDQEDQDGPEVEISLDEDDQRETGSNPDQRPQEDVLDSEEDEEAVLHLQQEQEPIPIHLDEGSRGSAAVVPEMISRSSSSHEVSVSVSGRGQSPEPEVSQSIPEASMSLMEQQQQVPIGSVANDGSQTFDDAADDSVVPSTPKLVGTQRGSRDAPEGFSELPANDPRFVFGGEVLVDASSDNDVISVDESGLASQGGLDSFSIDISQFASNAPGSHTVPMSGEGEEGLEDLGDELHEEIDLDDDEEDEVVIVDSAQEQHQPEGLNEELLAGPSGELSDTQVDSDSSQQPQPQQQQRAGRLSRTPIVWSSASTSSAEATQPLEQQQPRQPVGGRGGTAKRARGFPHFGRGGRGGKPT